MPYAVGSVLRLVNWWHDDRFEGFFKNILHFRVIEASSTGAQLKTYLEDTYIADYLLRVRANLCLNTSLARIDAANLTDLTEPTITSTFAAGFVNGQLDANDDDVPQAAACITRKSFLRGRKAIGHIYHGPLPSIFTSEGVIVPDPLLSGDLQDVLDAYGDPLVNGVTGWTARPIVCNALGTDVVANNDVRTQSIAFLTVYLKSRRQGKGE